jgi:hypothetical protein
MMDFPPMLDVLGDRRPDEPPVVVRLCLMAADATSGEPRLVSSFLRRISMPPVLASPDVDIALQIQGRRRVLKPRPVTRVETQSGCIVEVDWLVAEADVRDEIEAAELWPA